MDDEVGLRAGSADDPDYNHWFANVQDGVRGATSGGQAAKRGAREALVKIREDQRSPPWSVDPWREAELVRAMADVIDHGRRGGVDTPDITHKVLEVMRDHRLPVPPRMPDDPFPAL